MTARKRQDSISLSLRRPARSRLRLGLLALSILLVPPVIPHVLAFRIPGPSSRPADVVFVLSGGEGRITEGYKAWVSGAGKDLCILGADGTVTVIARPALNPPAVVPDTTTR